MSFATLLQRIVASDSMQTVAGMLPAQVESVLQTLATVNPAAGPINHGPLTSGEVLSGANLFLGSVGTGARLEGVNFFHGTVDGGVVRACNVALAAVNDGEVSAVNLWNGPMHGGAMSAMNIVVGDVTDGTIEDSHLLVGDIYGGQVSVETHVGRLLGGDRHCTRHAANVEDLER
jgi:hypothetical protein